MTEKPSRNEEEYFARRELELRQKSQSEALKAADLAARQAHHMKCPKCGADLTTADYQGIHVERCPECHGVWFDAGEAESLLKQEGGVIDLLRSMIRGVGSG